jgi:hypothetical protein
MGSLRAFAKILLIAPIAAAIIVFSVANRASVTVSFDPLARDGSGLSYAVPLYLLVLAAIGLGVLAGGLAAWLGQGRHRKAERSWRREAQGLRVEADRLKASLSARGSLPEPR